MEHRLGRGDGEDEVGLDQRRADSQPPAIGTRSSPSASWTTTRPRNARACGGRENVFEIPLRRTAVRARPRRGWSGARRGCRSARARRWRSRSPPAARLAARRAAGAPPARPRSSPGPRALRAPRAVGRTAGSGARRAPRRHVDDLSRLRRRPQHDVVVAHRHEDDARSGEKRDTSHVGQLQPTDGRGGRGWPKPSHIKPGQAEA